MTEHKDDLAKILMYENGRPALAATAEIAYATSFFEWFQREAVRVYGNTLQGSSPGSRALTLKLPIGVVGVLTPWNFPSAMITRKVAAVGNALHHPPTLLIFLFLRLLPLVARLC